MIHLKPQQLRVQAIYVRSTEKVSDEELRERRLLLGLFPEGTLIHEIESAIEKSNLWHKVVAHHTLVDGKAFMSMIPRMITEGHVFENAEEFVQYLKAGVYYEDIVAGYAMVEQNVQI
jgi:hypothetical protein